MSTGHYTAFTRLLTYGTGSLIIFAGWRVAEVPILFEDRVAGVSKISRREILNALSTVWRLARQRTSKLQHPLNRTA